MMKEYYQLHVNLPPFIGEMLEEFTESSGISRREIISAIVCKFCESNKKDFERKCVRCIEEYRKKGSHARKRRSYLDPA